MLRKGIYVVIGLIFCFELAVAQGAESLADAKQQAATRRQPLLLAFITDDCDDCNAFKFASQGNADVQGALGSVAFYLVDTKTDEGAQLAKQYDIGIRMPAFILTDDTGREITRWRNFLAPQPWLKKYGRANSDVTTIEDRLARLNQSTNFQDALVMGNYYLEADRPTDAVRYYRVADRLNTDKRRDLKFDVFHATVLGAWNGDVAFDEVERAADDVINSSYRTTINAARVATEITTLALRLDKTDRIQKYLKFAVQKLGEGPGEQYAQMRSAYEADFELFVNFDTAAAIEKETASLGPAFRRQAGDHYKFAIWCIDRGVNLDEAGSILSGLYDSSDLRHKTEADKQFDYSRLALAKGDVKEALRLAREACRLDPVNPLFFDHLATCEKRD